MNIIDLLKEDHRQAVEYIDQLEEETNYQILVKLKNALALHTQIEEEIFYPALRKFEETAELITEAHQEHNDIEQILEELSTTEILSDDFQDLTFQLRESVNHHVGEEENQLFPFAENLLSSEDLDKMGLEMKKMKSMFELTDSINKLTY